MGISIESRYTGSLLGLTIGDALGAPVEFMRPGTFKPISDMQGRGPFRLPAGYWQMIPLCPYVWQKAWLPAKNSMQTIKCNAIYAGFSQDIIVLKKSLWYRANNPQGTNLLLSHWWCQKMRANTHPKRRERFPDASGTYSIILLQWHWKAIFFSGESSRTTHPSQVCIDACRLFGRFIWQALHGASKDEIFVLVHAYANEDKISIPI